MVGVLMIGAIKNIELNDLSEAFPAFITMITIVLCYSISDGICLGILAYVVIKLGTWRIREISPTLIVLSILFILNFVFG